MWTHIHSIWLDGIIPMAWEKKHSWRTRNSSGINHVKNSSIWFPLTVYEAHHEGGNQSPIVFMQQRHEPQYKFHGQQVGLPKKENLQQDTFEDLPEKENLQRHETQIWMISYNSGIKRIINSMASSRTLSKLSPEKRTCSGINRNTNLIQHHWKQSQTQTFSWMTGMVWF